MKNFQQFLEEKKGLYKRQYGIFESQGLSRLWEHAQKDKGMILCSAYRLDKSEEENQRNHEELRNFLGDKKIGYWIVDGVWTEDGKEIGDPEPSFVIPYRQSERKYRIEDQSEENFLQLAKDIQKKYKQNAVLIKMPNDSWYEINKFGDKISIGDLGFYPDKIAQGYSRFIKGHHANRTFTFEGVEVAGDQGTIWSFKYRSQLGRFI